MVADIWASHAVSTKQLDKQIRAWEQARKERLAKPVAKRPEVELCICISREVGAGGSEIAHALGDKLGWAVFDQELLHFMAGDDVARKRVYASMDERDLNWFENAARSFADPDFRVNDYLHKLTKAVLSIARQGHAIFVGRGASCILPPETTLAVRLIAPLPDRVERFAKRRGISAAQAQLQVDSLDQDRTSFLRRHFHIDADDPSNYDLVINTGRCCIPAAIELITQAIRLRPST